jgi:uncharacterized protein (UPF0333 family)
MSTTSQALIVAVVVIASILAGYLLGISFRAAKTTTITVPASTLKKTVTSYVVHTETIPITVTSTIAAGGQATVTVYEPAYTGTAGNISASATAPNVSATDAGAISKN